MTKSTAERLLMGDGAEEATKERVATLETALDAARESVAMLERREGEATAALRHQFRNRLARIRSVFRRTATASDSLEDLVQHFEGRLDAIIRAALAAMRDAENRVDLQTLVLDELLSVGAAGDPRVGVDGPVVHLPAEIAEPLTLAMHELVTNSIKFGVLGASDGRGTIDLRWTLEGDALDLRWDEQGIAIVSGVLDRAGFGREFIEQGLPYQTGAITEINFDPGRIHCTIRLGLTKPRSVANTSETNK